MRISDWSSDVCSSDLLPRRRRPEGPVPDIREQRLTCLCLAGIHASQVEFMVADSRLRAGWRGHVTSTMFFWPCGAPIGPDRSEEHTSELQSLMRISYAVFCLKKTITYITIQSARIR